MAAIYNELQPYPSQWLRNLVEAGHIATGVVDERDIKQVQPADVRDATQFHAFAGIGAWSHALRLAGWPDDVPVWTGSCPCQPFSIAGERKGLEDERHLWPEWLRLIKECRPTVIFGEQVASPDGRAWLDTVSVDLEALGYAVGSADLCGASVGAPHIRQRLFFVAYTERPRLQRWGGAERNQQRANRQVASLRSVDWGKAEWLACRDGRTRPVEPGTLPLAHGIAARVGRLRAYGNAIIPDVAATFITAFIESVMTQEEIGELLCPEDFIFVSVSQGSTWEDCNRKWGFDKINHVERPVNPVLEFGKTGHKHAQNWIKKGTTPPDTPEGNTFKLGIKKGWLPAPKTKGVFTEEQFAREMHEIADDLLFIGYIDIVDVRNPEHPIVTDHKFTKDLRYAMDEEELSNDTQAIGYARILFDETEAQKVTARWIYYCASQPQKRPGQSLKPRKPKSAKKIEHTFVRGEDFNEKWARFVETARGIYHAKNNVKEAHELDANPRACGAYGGCPYAKDDPKTKKPYCKIEDKERFAAHWAQFNKGAKNMGGLFDKVKAKADKVAAAAPENTEEPAAPAAAAAPEKKKGSLSDKFNKMAGETKGNVVPLAGKAKVTPAAKAGGLNAAIAAKKNDGVNPPEQHEPDSGDDSTPETAAEKKKRAAKEKREQKKADKEAAEVAKAAGEEGATVTTLAVVRIGMAVLIDCLPVKASGDVVQLVDILAPSMTAVAEKIGEPHWNLIDFGKGSALLATAFDEWLDNNPINATVLVDGSSDESRAVREVLIAHAATVVRGMR